MKRFTKTASRTTFGFRLKPLHAKKEPHPVFFLRQQGTFWVATVSLLAFMIGNMVGQHGWYLFWASVLGKEDVVYTGTVAPIASVPDYTRWNNQYGGDPYQNTFRQVPKDLLIPLPLYTASSSETSPFFSVSYMGDYHGHAEGTGSHPGVDIRVPVGTPVLSIANGIVDSVKTDAGFGNVIVLRHPNVPDPRNSSRTTTLYSVYAHLDSMLVTVGMVVSKGEQIGTSGMTGFASGPHLHFQIDLDSAPWHPYWPFTTQEQHAAHLTLDGAVNAGLNKDQGFMNTASPLLYTQANFAPAEKPVVAVQDPRERLLRSVEERRLARLRQSGIEVAVAISSSSQASEDVSPAQQAQQVFEEREQTRLTRQFFADRQTTMQAPTVVSHEEVVSTDPGAGLGRLPVEDVLIRHDGYYSGRGWEEITVQLVDAQRNVVKNPQLDGALYMRTAYGDAEFRPSMLTAKDFINGEATVHMLPLGRRTVVIQARPFTTQSDPMIYLKQ